MVAKKKPAAHRPLVLLKRRVIGVDADGWRWIATWQTNGTVEKTQRCLTDVTLTKHRGGEIVTKRPYQSVAKSGEGRCQLRCPRGIPGPRGAPNGGWSGDGGARRTYWSRFVAWYFCRRPEGCTLQEYFTREGQSWKWAAASIF